jgi:alpha-tubulin suppressor-like RCC1 family protein
MKAWQRSRRLGGYAALVLGVAGAALTGAGTAQAGVIPARLAVVFWGDNGNLIPQQMASSTGVVQASAGGAHSLVLSSDGTVRAWGGNDSGQLGDGTLGNHLTPERVTGIRAPSVTGISAGEKFAVAPGSDGSVWAWGSDDAGQLGNEPTASPVTRPVETTGMDSGITQVSAGASHVLALKSNGTVLAWGDNTEGELGTGSTASVTGAVQVAGLTSVTQVAAGAGYSLAVRPAAGVSLPSRA